MPAMDDDSHILGEDLPLPPARLFERLAQLPGYTWDQIQEPFHSTYSHWHVFGLRHSPDSDASTPAATASSRPSSLAARQSSSSSPRTESRPCFRHHWRSSLSESGSDLSLPRLDYDQVWMPVIARVSAHVVRLEREFHMIRTIVQTADPECNHTPRPLDLIRLPRDSDDAGPLLVAIFESPGPDMLRDLVAFGPAAFFFPSSSSASSSSRVSSAHTSVQSTPGEQISLPLFLDFAIGACDCLEILHYGLKTVHGEIRGDAFHFARDTGQVRLISTGNGARSFDNALSEGWSTLSRELGAKNKLQFIAPEQTGRMPTEPDSRTDIYALGILFWILLVGRPAFDGHDPVEVVQNVLAKKLAPVSTKRMDVPDAISAVIQKMTRRSVGDRYHTISAVKRDLADIAQLLGDANREALQAFQVAQHDVSSFFTLPTRLFGRRDEQDRILAIVDSVHQRQQTAAAAAYAAQKISASSPAPLGLYGLASISSASEGRVDSPAGEFASASSDSGSLHHHSTSRTNSIGTAPSHQLAITIPLPTTTTTASSVTSAAQDSLYSAESSLSTQRPPSYTLNKVRSTSSWDTATADRESYLSTPSSSTPGHLDPAGLHGLPSRRRTVTARKFRHNGICEVIAITGAPGIGKTDLINRVQPAIRKLGYIAVARLDRARRIPFEPFAKILASLLRQIFSERDVTTEYHHTLRTALRPLWPKLHRVLELPEQLLASVCSDNNNNNNNNNTTTNSNGNSNGNGNSKEPSPRWPIAHHLHRREGLGSVGRSMLPGPDHGQSSVDFFLSNAASKNLRLMETFLDILRTLCQFKLICLCIDDVHYADDETLELVNNIVKAKLPCVLILTCRRDELVHEDIQSFFDNTDRPNCTRLVLNTLKEDETMQFVAATMHQDPNPSLTPLTAVIQEKSLGNPFYIRMMLETCYNKNCVWYSWKNSRWEFDLDRIFTEFVAPTYGEGLGLSFLTRRLQELPPVARSIMIWGTLLGSPFSFALVERLLTSEFLYSTGDDDDDDVIDVTCPQMLTLIRQSEADVVMGLQLLVQAYVLVPGETDDEFKFANDRFTQAVADLRECHNVEKMHFIIAQTMMKYYHDGRSRYSMARHIALAAQIIRARVVHRKDYRTALWDAAQTAAQSGARPTALWYFRHCLALLQDDPWNGGGGGGGGGGVDVDYDETLRLHIAAAETMWLQGHHREALNLLDEVQIHGKTAECKAQAWVVQARIHVQTGNPQRAMQCLTTSLDELGVPLGDPKTWEECDAMFRTIKAHFEKCDVETVLQMPCTTDRTLTTIGNVLAAAVALLFWDDPLTYYRMAVEIMKVHIYRGGLGHICIGRPHLAMMAFSRFHDLDLGIRLSDFSAAILERCPPAERGVGPALQFLFVDHLRVPLAPALPRLEHVLESSPLLQTDPYALLFALTSMALARLALGHDMLQIETFCNDGPEEIPDWTSDVRGGTALLAIRQVARAMQGKTAWHDPHGVMSDQHHRTDEYLAFLYTHSCTSERPRDIYQAFSMIPLFAYGHYSHIIALGAQMDETIIYLWTLRCRYSFYFYMALSHLVLHFENPAQSNLEQNLDRVLAYKAEVDFARSACDVNYGMWSLLLEALLSEYHREYDTATCTLEAAIDHCQLHGWPFEEALALELHAEYLIRRGAKRAARSITQSAIAAWASIGANGKVQQLSEKHEWLLRTATTSKAVDAACQTVDSLLAINRSSTGGAGPDHLVGLASGSVIVEDDRKHRWIEQNGATLEERSLDISSVGLDIIDLSSILESSQVMSSELQIDKLLLKMIEIIIESCNGSDFAVIARRFENTGFAVAAAGDVEMGQKSWVDGLPFAELGEKMAQQISHYVLRTREEVFVHNVLEDERFANVSEAYQARYPLGRSVIALPILQADHLVGVIHIEGKPNSFTQRNVVVLHLLCNQIGISLSNASLFHEVRKVSAFNASMIEAQKKALAQAREAEQKAKVAEAEAKHNVKLKEDAAKAKSIFLANISHDLRTPMNGVIGLSELLKKTNLSKEQDEYVESIRVCADTLLTLINDILDFSKLEAGKMKISTVPLNIRETISEVVRALRYTHRDRGLETIEDLDKVPPDLVVMGDPVRLHQIFMNLLSNSYKFTPKGSVTVKAKISREGKSRVRLECSVSDTGIGIPEEQKSRLFRPFSQADSSTARSYGGSGLGLSICKAIIEDVLGGAIWLESTPGVGTTVTFHLAFSKAPKETIVKAPWSQNFHKIDSSSGGGGGNGTATATATATATSAAAAAAAAAAPKPLVVRDLSMTPRDQIRVCIAEDNPINQKIAVKFVHGLGLQCEAYSDGRQAVDALRLRAHEGNPFHVVLMDVQMPTLDGYNATREIRRDPDPDVNQVLVIAMTASAIEGDREKCLEAGMNNYLPKPVRSTILSEMLDKYLEPAPSYSKLAIRKKTRGSISHDLATGTGTGTGTGTPSIVLAPGDDDKQVHLRSTPLGSFTLSETH
ncbi:hypothetical protein ASPZODRAFT_160906 [Penicilliopsis zonata CBS 506.65]|uniref:histidine kinase n=1 Tax=Penicilliopsis zonata CBS 506.65 TaxID=1073090 RepID=A0A1L9SAV9_9EURO|nr:hypothetical protein ASPZODRAFT_160906 [Penicilliopsis zonata CBS 506.65]OJJ44276.1 hypothetical protein ASPZODRAFT_160906 [Penicilliopsis zonata CBS 506.65]